MLYSHYDSIRSIQQEVVFTVKPIELRDILSYRFLSDVQYSPDGRRAALIVTQCNEEKNSYDSQLWLREGSVLRALVDLDRLSHFIWLDDARILFSRPMGQKTLYCTMDIAGGEPAPLFELPFSAEEIRMLDATHFAAICAIDANHPDGPDQSASAGIRGWEVLDEAPAWSDGCGYTNKKRWALFVISVDPLRIQRITAPLDNVNTMTVLGDEIYYNIRTHAGKAKTLGCQIHAFNWRTGEDRIRAKDDYLSAEQLVHVQDSVWLAANDKRRYGRNTNPWFYRLLPDDSLELLRREEYNTQSNISTDCHCEKENMRMAKGDVLYTLSARGGNSHLYRIHSDGSSEAVITEPGSIDWFAVSEHSDEILLIAMFNTRLAELYSYHLKTGELRQLSHFNDDALADRYIAGPQNLHIQSAGCDIEGWVLLPYGYDPDKRYPAVLDIHGGPKTAYGPIFMHSMQLLAGMGYFVFYCNPRGSDGGDNEFMDIRGHYGETDYQNIMDFTDAVLAAYPQIDPRRVCVMGGSYGGFMTNWIVGHTDRFCCASSQRSICNWVSCYGTSDIGLTFVLEETAGTPYTNPEKMWKQSPLCYAANIHTPTLLLHSDEDYRCPLEQGLQMYTALMDQGIPTRMCLFHGENHDLSRTGKPLNRIRRLEEITRWFETYAREK